MSGILRSGRYGILKSAILFMVLTALLCIMAIPAQGGSNDGGVTLDVYPDWGDVDEFIQGRPYYATGVVEQYLPGAGPMHIKLAEKLPTGLLPDSLRRGEVFNGGGGSGGSARESGAGTGGWTAISRPYTPSADPAVTYRASSFWPVATDVSGRTHYIYRREVTTDISQFPDPAGFAVRPLCNLYYTQFSDGAWSAPENLTGLSPAAHQDCDPLMLEVDSDDYLHLVYSAWTWGVDPNLQPGNPAAYQPEGNNLLYRYRTPDGVWSAPRALTSYTGSWAMEGAEFMVQNNRVYGSFVSRLNREVPFPGSYRAHVGFVEGAIDEWAAPAILRQWDFTQNAGQTAPIFWPSIAVSERGGEVNIVFGTETIGAVANTSTADTWGVVRSTGGTWSSVDRLTAATANNFFMPIFVFYRRGENNSMIFGLHFRNFTDATNIPRENYFKIDHDGGWGPVVSLTDAGNQQAAVVMDLEADTFNDLHLVFSTVRFVWNAGPATWDPVGDSFSYNREVSGTVATPEILRAYQADRFVYDTEMRINTDGNADILYSRFRMAGGGVLTDFTVSYVGNSSGAFASSQLRSATTSTIPDVMISSFPDGDILTTWLEKRVNAVTAVPEVGRIFSRFFNGTDWSATENISEVPSGDIIHVIGPDWPQYHERNRGPFGEQQYVYETAKYNVPGANYYDFNKYFVESINGSWTEPQLISNIGISGESPAMHIDENDRVLALFGSQDPATAKEVVYGSMQPEPTPPATTYYFAEGTTRAGFEEWISIQNANDDATNVRITYMLETGENIVQDIIVEPHSRMTVDVNLAVGPEHDVSAKVEADRLIVAERPMYFDFRGWQGGHDCIGALTTSRLWYFAEGTTRQGFAEWLTLQNPSDVAANVNITYVLEDGSTQVQTVNVGARSRGTVDVNLAVGEGRDVSMVVECPDVAIVAERPMYFNYHDVYPGGHAVVGSRTLANRWYFAEGTTRTGFDTYLSVQNPFAIDTVANFTFILGDGTTQAHAMPVPATSRQTLRVNDVIAPEQDVSTVVEADSLILVERPMYFNYRDKWTGGHVAVGARNPKNAWYLAEGTTRDGFEEWLSLQNPSEFDMVATLSFMLEDGTVQNEVVGLPAHTRITVDVPLTVGTGRDVSVEIWAQRGIIAERPMYFLYHGMWPGGHDVVGL